MKRRCEKVFRCMSSLKRTAFPTIIVCLWVVGSVLAATYYNLSGVKRVDSDLYKTSDGLYIETQYCYHYTFGENAVLKWEGKYGNNKIIWDDDSTCGVKNIWRK